MRKHTPIFAVLGLGLFLIPSLVQGSFFDKGEYASRRSKLMEKIPDGAAILLGAVTPPDSSPFYQNNDLIYFCGKEKFRALQRIMTFNTWDGRLSRELQFVKQLKDKFPHAEIRDCASIEALQKT